MTDIKFLRSTVYWKDSETIFIAIQYHYHSHERILQIKIILSNA